MVRRKAKRRSLLFPPLWAVLCVIILIQAVWIALFVQSTGAWLPGRPASAARAAARPAPQTQQAAADPRDAEISELKRTVQNLQRRLMMDREDRMADIKVQELIEKRGSKGSGE